MKPETYRRKIEELEEKIANTNPRFRNKIAAMEEQKEHLEQRLAEKEQEEESSNDVDGEDEWGEDIYDYDDDDDDEYLYDEDDDEYEDEKYVNDIDDSEFIRENVILGGPDGIEEVAVCPNCHSICQEDEGKYDEFTCINCGTNFSAELNNYNCEQCTCRVSELKAIKKDCFVFCSEYHRDVYFENENNPAPYEPEPEPKPDAVCIYCKKSKCRNDESYYYGQTCPGDCDHWYH